MSRVCDYCNKSVVGAHSCKEGFEASSLGKFMSTLGTYCNGCIHLSPTEEEQDKMKIKLNHRCAELNTTVFHGSVHPNIVKHPNCPGKETA